MPQLANIIIDQTNVVPFNGLQIIKESEDISSSPTGQPINKIIFKAILQTAEEDNQNGRYYKRPILEEIVRILSPKANARSLFQEVDHPFAASSDVNILKKRAITVKLQNCGALIRKLYMEENNVIGEIETLSGFKGPDIYNLIANDQATIGFSVRMFGKLVRDPLSNRMYVEKPIRPVTYDIVTNPSHSGSVVLEFLPEDINNLKSVENSQLITEDLGILETDNLSFNGNNITETIDYLSDLLEESYSSMRLVQF